MKATLSFLFILFIFNTQAQFELVWSDEFDGTELDLTKWNFDLGAGGWGNAEPQYYTANDNNIDVDTGYLRITAINEDFGGAEYTSSRIKTKGLYEVQYGKIEARIKIPKGQGLWPAFWMLGSNIDEVSWPQCGEIDIMEHINNSFYIHGTYHYNNFGHTYFGQDKAADVEEFQVYSIEWDASKIRWYLNDILYFTANIEDGIGSTEEFHEPFFILLNMATGGNWPGYPDESTVFPASMFVDYVRVYQKSFASIATNEIEDQFNIYPNPASDLIIVNGLNKADLSNYSIYSLSGENLSNGPLPQSHEIVVSDLKAGCYILAIKDLQGNIQNRFRLMIQ